MCLPSPPLSFPICKIKICSDYIARDARWQTQQHATACGGDTYADT